MAVYRRRTTTVRHPRNKLREAAALHHNAKLTSLTSSPVTERAAKARRRKNVQRHLQGRRKRVGQDVWTGVRFDPFKYLAGLDPTKWWHSSASRRRKKS